MAFSHETKAEAINRTNHVSASKNSAGTLYQLEGNVASPIQFFVTDSSNYFLRGGLYFENIPNADSLAPVVEFIKDDIVNMMETIQWQDSY
ncbi:MAG: hypothetical protein HRT74_11515 [Flavobacteriales bacterium]|nr:hypothetical protein [Flavobacteriales bacterium]